MEATPASAPSAAPAAAAPPAASSAEHTPAAAASPSPQVNVNANGTPGAAPVKADEGTGKWTDSFDADSKEYIAQKGFQDQKALLESYRNLEKLRGVPQERLLKLPEPGDDKGMSEVFEKLGKPPTPEGYGLQAKDPKTAGFTNWAKDTFHKLNLTTEQGQALVNQFNDFNAAQEAETQAQHTAAIQEQTSKLKKEWGAAFQQNINKAQAAYRQFGIPDTAIDSLEKSIGFDGVMKLFSDLGSKVGEHAFIGGDSGSSFGEGVVLTPEQANARIKALKQDQTWANEYLKGSVKHRQEMERLMKMANPTD